MTSNISRRTVAKGAVWAVPAVVTASTVPAYAASPEKCAGITSNWAPGLGGYAGFPFRSIPLGGSPGQDAETVVPLEVNAKGEKVTDVVYMRGLPKSLNYNSAKKVIEGTPTLAEVGEYAVTFVAILGDGTRCNVDIPVQIGEFAAEGRWTENWGGGKQTANVMAVHWRNTTETPICGNDFKMRIWVRATNADGSPKTSGVSLMAAPLSSLNVSNYSTTTGAWSVGSPANQSLLVKEHKNFGMFCEDNELGLGGMRPYGNEWVSASTIRYLSAWAGVKCALEKRLVGTGITRVGEGFWDLTLQEGACLLPGEVIHAQVAQVGPGTVPWVGELEVNTPVLSTKLSSHNNTYLHRDWDQPNAGLYTPGVNGGFNGIF